jgi:hypothetical protein
MAATYTALAVGVTFASGKKMLSLFNGSGSGKVLRVYRMWLLNNQTTGVTGVLTTMEIRKLSASSGGTAVTPVKHDSNSGALPAQVLCAQGATDTETDLFRKFMWSNDEPAASSATNDELECLPALAQIWDAGYGDSNVEPITLRPGEGVNVRQLGTSAVGLVDVAFEFTCADT